MSFIDQLAELAKAKAKIAQTEAKLASDRVTALAKLPAEYGFSNLNEFIQALKSAVSKSGKASKAKGKKVKEAKAPKAAEAGKRARAKITPELKQQVIAAVQAGQSGAQISDAFGISLPSVQNIKKEAGLVKSRIKSEASPEAQSVSGVPASS